MKFLILAGLLSTATALPIPLEQYGGSSSEQRFGFYPPQGPPFFPQILFPPPPQLPLVPIPIPLPFPFDPNQTFLSMTPNQKTENIHNYIYFELPVLNQKTNPVRPAGFLGQKNEKSIECR
ncbi:unnamed protein product [Nyctereutes procyonoides]|uniref:(raccoon dog) hypothetical protein n=1 Tax=Nyctereutes procyonoides TaxID=34880 RepID=A0A811ZXW8_NYCPR|nr:unnamed protein product [Nyctereutes procyonoides]